jgi:hypothetical protein
MANFPDKGFSAADPDDEIDLEALVKKNPPPQQPAPVKQAAPQSTQPPRQEKPRAPAAPQSDIFDVGSFPKAASVQNRPAAPSEQKKQPQPAHPPRAAAPVSADYDGETEFDHPVHRKRVRILPSLPTLILIIFVSAATAIVTGVVIHLTSPSLDNKMQEILSNQENTSLKVNNLEQTVSKMVDDIKALQTKPQPQAAPAAPKKHAAKPKAAPAESEPASPAPETGETQPAE